MQLKDDTNQYNSLYHLSLRWARADSNNFTYADFIQSLNMAVNRLTAVAQRHDKSWKSQDTNSTSNLLDTTNDLTIGENIIAISTPWRKISRIRIKESNGTSWKTLTFKSRDVVTDDEMVSGMLEHYYLLGGKLYIVGFSNYAASNGVEVQYQEGPVAFTPEAGDEDAVVGFDPIFEELAALMPALDYLEINGPDEQARKVEVRIGVEPRRGIEGSGLLNALAVTYQERHDIEHTLSLARNNTANGLLNDYSGNYPLY